jgi:hypothetical protein
MPPFRMDVVESQKTTESLQVPACRVLGNLKIHMEGYAVYQALPVTSGCMY